MKVTDFLKSYFNSFTSDTPSSSQNDQGVIQDATPGTSNAMMGNEHPSSGIALFSQDKSDESSF